MIKNCEVCGEEFRITPYLRNIRFCCSYICRKLRYHARRPKKKCEYCGNIFSYCSVDDTRHKTGRKYCSISCKHKSSRHRAVLRCQHCGKRYEVIFSRRNTSRYCSRVCSDESKRAAKNPNKEQLESLTKRASTIEIGKLFNVHANTVRKWYRRLGITPTRAQRLKFEKEQTDPRGVVSIKGRPRKPPEDSSYLSQIEIGKEYGHLTALEKVLNKNRNKYYIKVRCQCGKKYEVDPYDIIVRGRQMCKRCNINRSTKKKTHISRSQNEKEPRNFLSNAGLCK